MGIFNELYGTYFRIVSAILSADDITEKKINELICRDGFSDSMLFLPNKLLPSSNGGDWRLLERSPDGNLHSKLLHKPVTVMTLLQKRWLKAVLSDPRMRLFMDDEYIRLLDERLRDIEPLYKAEHFRYVDIFSDGDDFSDTTYIKHFRMLLYAIRKKEILEVSYRSGHDNDLRVWIVPIKLEYSAKNNKFRVYCCTLKKRRIRTGGIMNVGRIVDLKRTGQRYSEDIDIGEYFRKRRADEPVSVRVTNERNGIERFLTEFAAYEKRTSFDKDSKSLTADIFYDKTDETELLIRLLSFGPVLEILAPSRFRQLAAERIVKQYNLYFP